MPATHAVLGWLLQAAVLMLMQPTQPQWEMLSAIILCFLPSHTPRAASYLPRILPPNSAKMKP